MSCQSILRIIIVHDDVLQSLPQWKPLRRFKKKEYKFYRNREHLYSATGLHYELRDFYCCYYVRANINRPDGWVSMGRTQPTATEASQAAAIIFQ